jgi:hypothetical protein
MVQFACSDSRTTYVPTVTDYNGQTAAFCSSRDASTLTNSGYYSSDGRYQSAAGVIASAQFQSDLLTDEPFPRPP